MIFLNKKIYFYMVDLLIIMIIIMLFVVKIINFLLS